MSYTVEEFKDIMTVNDLAFRYKGKEYYIFQGNNSCIVGNYAEDDAITYDKAENFDQNLDDTLNNWVIENKPLKDIINDIELI